MSASSHTPCTGTKGRTVPLAVLSAAPASHAAAGPKKPRASRSSWKRALVLLLINVLMVIHIVHWLRAGTTLAPIEPSESMYTLELGRLNPGFIFFVIALLATFLFGRFFCGWGCHVVALQDACSWMMNKAGIRPRPFRSRLLLLGPTLLALYMFVWPTFKREALVPLLNWAWPAALAWVTPPPPFPGFSTHLMTDNFWATFPPWYVAIPFFLICGFACVYFLGSKGYCTYGCPYGGFFAPMDKLSIGKIVVNDNCEGCGHCTATCTSNVRVHQEVRDYGMVVDPGCMKCMDCVSVCPNEALSFSFAKPSVLAKPRPEVQVPFTPQRPPFDVSLWQDALLLALAIGLFIAFRGMLDMVPLLMAAGMAGIGIFFCFMVFAMVRETSVRLQNLQLKIKGRITFLGGIFALVFVGYLALGAWAGTMRYHLWRGEQLDGKVNVPLNTVLAAGYKPDPQTEATAKAALRHFRIAGSPGDGGWGWQQLPKVMVRVAWLHAAAGEWDDAERVLLNAIDMAKPAPSAEWVFFLARAYMAQNRPASDGKDLYERVLDRNPDLHEVRLSLAMMWLRNGNSEKAIAEAQRLIKMGQTGAQGGTDESANGSDASLLGHESLRPAEPFFRVRASEIIIDAGRPALALSLMQEAVKKEPGVALYHAGLATASIFGGDPQVALAEMRKAVELEPQNTNFRGRLIDILRELGLGDEAQTLEKTMPAK